MSVFQLLCFGGGLQLTMSPTCRDTLQSRCKAGSGGENHSVCLFFKVIIKHSESRHHTKLELWIEGAPWTARQTWRMHCFFSSLVKTENVLTSTLRLTTSADLRLYSIVKFRHFETLPRCNFKLLTRFSVLQIHVSFASRFKIQRVMGILYVDRPPASQTHAYH